MADKHRLEAMLGSARFQKYYEAAAQDVDRAVDLYRWNTRLAGEFHAQLSYFEILLRNAMDSALRDWNFQECGHRDWCVERQTAGLLYEMMSTPLRQARKRALRESKRRGLRTGVSHDDILAQLTMGNWSNLLGEALPVHKSNAKVLWKVGLHLYREPIGKRISGGWKAVFWRSESGGMGVVPAPLGCGAGTVLLNSFLW